MKTTVLDDIYYWSAWQPERRIDFHGFAWTAPEGNALVDPLPLDDERAAFVASLGGARWILLTNFDHLRAAPDIARRFGARIAAPAGERGRFGDRTDLVDHWFEDTASLPAEFAGLVDVHRVAGGKSPVEAVFWLRGSRALLFGDVVRSHVSGRLRLLPDDKLADAERVAADLRDIDAEPAAILVGDGDCVFTGAADTWREFVAALPG